ncbi:hypothetical protein BBP40_011549, partial [Aspergillus hancockii]
MNAGLVDYRVDLSGNREIVGRGIEEENVGRGEDTHPRRSRIPDDATDTQAICY